MRHANRTTMPTGRLARAGALLVVATLLLPLAACQETEQGTEDPAAQTDEAMPASPQESWEALGDSLAETLTEIPADSAARAVIAYLDGASYEEQWAHWPDRDPYYEGAEPHGMLLSTYMNDGASATLTRLLEGDEDHLPVGSFVVKENHQPDSTLVAVTVMVKAGRGYDPEHNDWFWLKYAPSAPAVDPREVEVEAAGRVDSCISCHGEAGEADFLRTAAAQMADPR
jgi:hypothetical protein